MTEPFQQCFEQWRAAQPEGEPTLRQEIAYKAGFEDALKLMHPFLNLVPTTERLHSVTTSTDASQAERV